MKLKEDRIGEQRINTQGLVMTICEYNRCEDIWVVFEDGAKVHTNYSAYNKGNVRNPNLKIPNIRNINYKKERLYQQKLNSQGDLMTIIEYSDANHLKVQFEDKYHAIVTAGWHNFEKGVIRNPYHPNIFGKGMVGDKYRTTDEHGQKIKEYSTWAKLLERVFNSNSSKDPSYIPCQVCDEWLLFSNFYEWVHIQPNYQRWKENKYWAIDKDIIKKGNKIYCPDYCCLVPPAVNSLFIQDNARRGQYAIGVTLSRRGLFLAQCGDPFTNKNLYLGEFDNEYDAFLAYKNKKEELIKQMAVLQYEQGNISQACYNGMIQFKIEFDD